MAAVDFTDELLTGNDAIDEQHRSLFEWANRVLEHDGGEPDSRTVLEVLAFLAGYVNYHFAEEEKAMERLAYPKLDQHRKLHATFRTEIEGIQQATAGGSFSRKLAAQLHYLMSDWLTYHISHVDQAFAEYAQDASLDLAPLPEEESMLEGVEDRLLELGYTPADITVVDQEGVVPAAELASRRRRG
jgi:hemerythrin